MTEQESNIIKTQDENGEIHSFELIDIINVDNQDYGLLIYVNEDAPAAKEDDDEEELVIMKLNQEDGQYTFEMIEDDDEFNKVIEALEEEAEEEEE